MREWNNCQLGAVADITSSKRIFYSDYVESGIPFWRSKEVIEQFNRKPISTDLFITCDKYNEIKDKYGVPQENDIWLTFVGTLGIPYLVKSGDCFYFKDGNLKWIRNIKSSELLPKYLYIWLSSQLGRDALHEITNGSTQEALTIVGLKSLDFSLPPLPEQKAIASVLSSLDDKIDLLHRQNSTLEKLAETLFRQWFVEVAEEDWEEGSLLEAIELVGGGKPKTAFPEYWDGNVPWLSGGDIASNHKSFVLNAEKQITELGLNNSSAKLLPKCATIISARGTVGKYCILARPMAFSQSNYGVLPRTPNCFFYTYLLINHVVEELQSSAYGSVFDTITTNTFRDIKLPLPPATIILNFESQIGAYFNKIILNKEQIHSLEKIRNTLLPKLMSGEVRVNV
jgi:type I restriction enzyme, S subunit